jgi:hypothetical protein
MKWGGHNGILDMVSIIASVTGTKKKLLGLSLVDDW